MREREWGRENKIVMRERKRIWKSDERERRESDERERERMR